MYSMVLGHPIRWGNLLSRRRYTYVSGADTALSERLTDGRARVPTYSRRDTYESSRFAIYAITANRHPAVSHQDATDALPARTYSARFALMHKRCHMLFDFVPFRVVSSSKEFLGWHRRQWHFEMSSRFRIWPFFKKCRHFYSFSNVSTASTSLRQTREKVRNK